MSKYEPNFSLSKVDSTGQWHLDIKHGNNSMCGTYTSRGLALLAAAQFVLEIEIEERNV